MVTVFPFSLSLFQFLLTLSFSFYLISLKTLPISALSRIGWPYLLLPPSRLLSMSLFI